MQGTVACSTHARIEPRAASGDQEVHKSACFHDLRRAAAGGVFDNVHDVRIKARPFDAALERFHDGTRGAVGFLSGAEHADVAAFDAQRRSVGGDVRAALVDDGDQPQRHLLFVDVQPVWARDFLENSSRVVRKSGSVPDTGRHPLEPVGAQAQPVEHDLGDQPARLLEIVRVFIENRVGML